MIKPTIDYLSFKVFNMRHNLDYLGQIFSGIEFKESDSYEEKKGNTSIYRKKKSRGVYLEYELTGQKYDYVKVEIRSFGLRQLEETGVILYDLLEWILENGRRKIDKSGVRYPAGITRIDVAFDDKKGLINPAFLFSEVQKNKLQTKMKSVRPVFTWNNYDGKLDEGYTLYIGDRASPAFVRVYDKRAKSLQDGEQVNDDIWYRLEFELKSDKANIFVKEYLEGEFDFGGFIRGMIDFKDRSGIGNKNFYRFPMADFWEEFLGSVEKYKLSLPESWYGLEQFEYFVEKRLSGSLKTYAELYGVEGLKRIVENKSTDELNKKHKYLIENCKDEKRKIEKRMKKNESYELQNI